MNDGHNRNALKIIRKARGLSGEKLAELVGLGWDKSYISRYEKGKVGIPPDAVKPLCKALDCTSDELFGITEFKADPEIPDIEQESPQVAVAGYVGAGQEIFAIDDFAKGDGLDMVDAPFGHDGRNICAVRVRGDSMKPVYNNGDTLFYRKECDFDPSYLRKECVVKLVDGRTYVKVLMNGSNPNTFTLMSFNAEPLENVKIEWACPVEYIKRG